MDKSNSESSDFDLSAVVSTTPTFNSIREFASSNEINGDKPSTSEEIALFDVSDLEDSHPDKNEQESMFNNVSDGECDMWEQFSQTDSSCMSSSSRLYLPDIVKKDPYVILNSLTSQQIRRLISTSYNAFKHTQPIAKMRSVDFEKASTSSSKKTKKSGRCKHKKNKTNCKCCAYKSPKVIIERISTPTHASIVRHGVSVNL